MNQAGIISIVFIGLIILIVSIYFIYDEKENSLLLEKLNSIDFFNKVENSLLKLFGSNQYQRCVKASNQTVSNFAEYKTLDYLIKYFGFVINDETIDNLKELESIILEAETITKEDKLYQKFQKYYPVFIMTYTSPQGRSSNQSEFKFNSNNINHLISEIEYKLSKRMAKGYERTKLTPAIRESILVRDNFTCCKCGNSQYKEPNLLLEVDHIIPISKGGKTEPNNLQTLCWRCNRKKSDNI